MGRAVEAKVTANEINPTCAEDILPAGAPRIGLGCGDIYAGEHEAASQRLLKTAYDCGVRYFDVARLYGDGSAEGVVGRAFAGQRDKVILVSKAGIIPWSMQTTTRIRRKALTVAGRLPVANRLLPQAPPAKERYGAFRPAELAKSVETSLRALRTDYIDILFLHECDVPDALRPETLSLLEKLRADGKIRAFGVATRFPETKAILDAEPQRFSAAQFPSDVFSRNEALLTPQWRGLTVTHSIYKRGLSGLKDQVTADTARAADWQARFGRSADDVSGYAELLLKDALASHDGIVLFTTSRPERIGPAVQAALTSDPAEVTAFREFLSRSGVLAAA